MRRSIKHYIYRLIEETPEFEKENKEILYKNITFLWNQFTKAIVRRFFLDQKTRIKIYGIGVIAMNYNTRRQYYKSKKMFYRKKGKYYDEIPDIDETSLPERERSLIEELKRDRANLLRTKKRAKNTDGQ